MLGIIGLATIIAIIWALIEDRKDKSQDNYEEESEKDKMYRAIRTLIYIIIFLILTPIVIKLLILSGVFAIIGNYF